MTDLEGLWATILEQPDDDAPRWIYADCLEEQGFEHDAKWLRLSLKKAELGQHACIAYGHIGVSCEKCAYCRLEQEESDAFTMAKDYGRLQRWLNQFHQSLGGHFGHTLQHHSRLGDYVRLDRVLFWRGTPSVILTEADKFLTVARQIRRQQPITHWLLSATQPGNINGLWEWVQTGRAHNHPGRTSPNLPTPLFELLEGWEYRSGGIATYPTRYAAMLSLERACVVYSLLPGDPS